MVRGIRRVPVTYSMVDALSNAFGEIQSLADEMRGWFDNMPEGFQNADKGTQVSEAADALENISEVELPELLDDHDKEPAERHEVNVMPLKRKASRSDRRDQAVEMLAGVRSIMEELIDSEDEAVADEAQTLFDELDNVISELDEIQFPGMYG